MLLPALQAHTELLPEFRCHLGCTSYHLSAGSGCKENKKVKLKCKQWSHYTASPALFPDSQ